MSVGVLHVGFMVAGILTLGPCGSPTDLQLLKSTWGSEAAFRQPSSHPLLSSSSSEHISLSHSHTSCLFQWYVLPRCCVHHRAPRALPPQNLSQRELSRKVVREALHRISNHETRWWHRTKLKVFELTCLLAVHDNQTHQHVGETAESDQHGSRCRAKRHCQWRQWQRCRQPLRERQHPEIRCTKQASQPTAITRPVPPKDKMFRLVSSDTGHALCSEQAGYSTWHTDISTAVCRPRLCRECLTSISSASAKRPPSQVSSTPSAASS